MIKCDWCGEEINSEVNDTYDMHDKCLEQFKVSILSLARREYLSQEKK